MGELDDRPAVDFVAGAAARAGSQGPGSPGRGATPERSVPGSPGAAARAGKYGRRWDATTLTPWYEFQDPQRPWLWWQGYYEDAESVVFKYSLVKHRRLKGVLLWMLNGCTQYEAPQMWQALREMLFGPSRDVYVQG